MNLRDRLRDWLRRRRHNHAVMKRVRDFERWSRYASEQGHAFFAALFEDKARNERKNLI